MKSIDLDTKNYLKYYDYLVFCQSDFHSKTLHLTVWQCLKPCDSLRNSKFGRSGIRIIYFKDRKTHPATLCSTQTTQHTVVEICILLQPMMRTNQEMH